MFSRAVGEENSKPPLPCLARLNNAKGELPRNPHALNGRLLDALPDLCPEHTVSAVLKHRQINHAIPNVINISKNCKKTSEKIKERNEMSQTGLEPAAHSAACGRCGTSACT